MPNDLYTWQNDLYPLVTNRFDTRYEKRMDVVSQVVGTETIDRIDLRSEGIGGFGEVPLYQGTEIQEMAQKRGFVSIFTPQERAGAATVTYKKAKVDLSGEANKIGTRLADSMYMTVLVDFYRLFSKAYSSSQLGADGQPWASAAHPINNESGAPTCSNIITDTFSVAGITKAQTISNRFVTYDGMPFLCNMDLLLIAPELEPKAKELLGENSKLIPESNENGSNPIYGMKYLVIGGGADFGFSSKQWAIADSNLLKETAKLVYITKPKVLYNKETSNPLVAKYTTYADYTYGFNDFRPIIFSNPS